MATNKKACYYVVTDLSYYEGVAVYVRRTMSRGHGPYFQLVRSYREEGKVKQEVLVHLERYETPEAALAAWPSEIEHLRRIGRDHQADRLEAKTNKLRQLVEKRNGEE
jgi:hypothetical protein